jgi:DNA-binding Lrp family transcriptional regulator
MDETILSLIEKNSRLSNKDLSGMLNKPEAEISAAISEMIGGNIICGFNTLINWDKTSKEFVTALIEVKVAPQRGEGFDKIAERIYRFEEVTAVYLMSGGFDLTVLIEGKTIKDIAYFVSDKLSPLESVLSTATHFVLKRYKDHGIILDKPKPADERMIVSP